MTSRRDAFAALAATWLAMAQPFHAGLAAERFEATHPTMGTEFRFVVYAQDAQRARAALNDAKGRLDALNASLSDYVATSEISRLSAASGKGYWRLLPDDLWVVLTRGNRLATQTKGAFDVTVGPLTRLWRVSRRTGRLPSDDRLAEALAATGFRFLELDAGRQRARLTRPRMRLDLGGIAKGYAVDEALSRLLEHEITVALVDGGGDLRVQGIPPDSDGWRIGVRDLASEDELGIRTLTGDVALATSGDLYQTVKIGGREFSHLIDPVSGLGLEFRRSVTVEAPDAITADALASALSVLPVAASRRLLKRHYPEANARILTKYEGTLEEVSLGMRK